MKNSQKGQGLIEYALVLVLVSVVVIAILTLLGPQIGNVFSRIRDDLGANGGTNSGATMAYRQRGSNGPVKYGAALPGSAEYALEKVDELRDGALEEEQALREVVTLMEETMLETLQAPIEYAEEAGDATLFDRLAAIRDAALAGDYEAVLALLAEPGGQGGSLPAEIRLKMAAKFTPRVIRACLVIDGKEVPYQDYADAREGMVLLGELDTAILLDEAWQIIEPRNGFINEIQPDLIQSAGAGISYMLDSGQPKYVTLAEQLQDDLAACGGG